MADKSQLDPAIYTGPITNAPAVMIYPDDEVEQQAAVQTKETSAI